MELKLPIDLTQLPQFRRLREMVGSDTGRAFMIWWTLWQELGYRAQEGIAPGRLPEADVPGVVAAIAAYETSGQSGEAIFKFLGEQRVLVADGKDWVCPRFALLHPELNPMTRSNAAKGGDKKAFNAKQRESREGALQLGLEINPEKFHDASGNPLLQDEANEVVVFITTLDNALFKQARPTWNFTEALLVNAVETWRKLGRERLNVIAAQLVQKRKHPLLSNMTAERLLEVNGEDGLREIEKILPKLSAVAVAA